MLNDCGLQQPDIFMLGCNRQSFPLRKNPESEN